MQDPIIWNVDPVLIPLFGNFGIRWYSLCFLVGFMISHKVMEAFITHAKKPAILADTLIYYAIGGTIIGARLGHCFFYEPMTYLKDPIRILMTWEGGLASHGGYLGLITSIYLFHKKYPTFSFFWLIDRAAILAVMTGGFIRLGNLFNSEIVGKPVTEGAPLAFIFPQVDMIPRHPTQIYESVGYFLISLIMYGFYLWKKKSPKDGQIFGLGLILGFGFRLFIENLKENQEAFEQNLFLNLGQILSIPFILFGFYLYFKPIVKKPSYTAKS